MDRPAYIGPDRARALPANLRSGPIDSWLESTSLRVEHPDARSCTLHIAACGTALFQILRERRPRSLTELAV